MLSWVEFEVSHSVLFFGGNYAFSKRCLEVLSGQHVVAGVVEGAPRKRKLTGIVGWYFQMQRLFDRLRPSRDSVIKAWADKQRVPYFLFEQGGLPSLLTFIAKTGADIGFVASFPRLLPTPVIEALPKGILNLHPSLLPNYRGPNPIFWIYHNQEPEAGVTVHFLDEGEDTGDIVLQARFSVPLGMPFQDFESQILNYGCELMLQALAMAATGEVPRRPQAQLGEGTRARLVSSGEQFVNWNVWSVERVFHFLQGTLAMIRLNPPDRPWRRMVAVLGFNHLKAATPPGSFQRDVDGEYINCLDGRVRVSTIFCFHDFVRSLCQIR